MFLEERLFLEESIGYTGGMEHWDGAGVSTIPKPKGGFARNEAALCIYIAEPAGYNVQFTNALMCYSLCCGERYHSCKPIFL